MDSIIRLLGWGFNECLERGPIPAWAAVAGPLPHFSGSGSFRVSTRLSMRARLWRAKPGNEISGLVSRKFAQLGKSSA